MTNKCGAHPEPVEELPEPIEGLPELVERARLAQTLHYLLNRLQLIANNC